jgi:predicted MFS family arabinose efflux permease
MIGLALGFYIGGQADDIFGPVFTGDASVRSQVGVLGRRIANGLHRHHRPIPLDQLSLYHPGHYYPSFYLSSALFVLATLVCAMVLQGRAPRAAGSPHQEHEQITWQRFTETARTVPQYIVLAFVTFLGIGNIAPIVKLFALDEFHMTEPQVGLLTLCTALIVATVAYPLGHLADRWSKVKSVRLGFSLCALGLWGIPTLLHLHSVREIGFVISAAVIGMGFVIAFPAWNALLTTLSDEERRGAVIGTVSTGQGVGMLLGYISGGAMYRPRHFMAFGHMMHIGGHSAPFFLAALLVSIGAIGSIVTIHEGRAQSG